MRSRPFESRPRYGPPKENGLLGVPRSNKWFCGDRQHVGRFEEAYVGLTGSRHCLATVNVANRLVTAELERRWNNALAPAQSVRREAEENLSRLRKSLSIGFLRGAAGVFGPYDV